MGISMNDYGGMITEPPLYITEGFTPEHISTGPRIGIDNSEKPGLSVALLGDGEPVCLTLTMFINADNRERQGKRKGFRH